MHGFAVKTLLKVDQNQNKNITYQYGRSKTNENETITEYIAGVCVWSMYTEFNLRYNVQFYRFQTFQCGHSKTHQNVSLSGHESIDTFSMKTLLKTH